MRRRKELREQLDVAELEDLAAAEPELLDRALARLGLSSSTSRTDACDAGRPGI
jgi:hypothetical protein